MSRAQASPSIRHLEPDHDAVLQVLQDQLDELLTIAEAQQAAIRSLQDRVTELEACEAAASR